MRVTKSYRCVRGRARGRLDPRALTGIEHIETLDGIDTATPQQILDHVIAFVAREVPEQADDVSLMVVRRVPEASA